MLCEHVITTTGSGAAHCLPSSRRLVFPQCSTCLRASVGGGKGGGPVALKSDVRAARPLAGAPWTFSRAALKSWMLFSPPPPLYFSHVSKNAASVSFCTFAGKMRSENEVKPPSPPLLVIFEHRALALLFYLALRQLCSRNLPKETRAYVNFNMRSYSFTRTREGGGGCIKVVERDRERERVPSFSFIRIIYSATCLSAQCT